jgi:RHS repeat-associated protein
VTYDYNADGTLQARRETWLDSPDGLVTLYDYDAENRLLSATPLDLTSGLNKVELAYDFMSRRFRKVVSAYGGSAWVPETEKLFVYDGWNLIKEITTTGGSTSTDFYVWGLDVSGSLHGAGGVGGLLSKTNDLTSQTFLYLYDANGNVGQLVNAADGSLAAHYEYDPFGSLLVADSPEALKNSIRFSTKFFDTETGWYYYGYRYYDPVFGRWPTRDPIGEQEGWMCRDV